MQSSVSEIPTANASPTSPLRHPVCQEGAESKRVLIVEDDEVLSRFIQKLLRAEGYIVTMANSGAAALAIPPSEIDLVVLDLNLPDQDGLAVLRALRHRELTPPVLVLTGRSRAESTVPALESGADDCLTKPFSYVELLARLRVLLRRHTESARPDPNGAALVIHQDQMSATRAGKRIDLTPREFALLAFLMRTPGVPVARTVLLQELWGENCSANSNVVDVYMKYVRDKVDLPGMPKLVHTVRGLGYVVREE